MARQAGRTVSMTDIARATGVSLKTVSRVVNEPGAVAPDTRQRVEEAMERMGFRVNFAGRTLKMGRYESVGLVMFKVTGGSLAVLDGILGAASAAGCAVTLVKKLPEQNLTLEAASRRMLSMPVDGMIFAVDRMVDDFQTFKPFPGLRTVLLSVPEHPFCSTFNFDHYGASRMVVEYLLERGHRDVRFVAGARDSLVSAERERGWADALRAHGVEPAEPLRGDWTVKAGYRAGGQLAADQACTAIYAANDAIGHGVIEALRDHGRRVPQDVSVIGVEDTLTSDISREELTVVRFDNEQLGQRVFQEAVTPAGEDVDAPPQVRFSGTLIERATVASFL